VAHAQPGVDLVATETEFNDSWRWADTMGSNTTAQGTIAAGSDVDSWRFVSTGGYHALSVSALAGATPIGNPVLTLRNANGAVVAFQDGPQTSPAAIGLYLPPGTYHADVSSFGGNTGGDYLLSISSAPVNLVPLSGTGAAGTTQGSGSPTARDVFTFTVPEGRLQLRVNAPGRDSLLLLQRSDGALLFVNDDSTVAGLNAAADIDLPAGTYHAYVVDALGQSYPFTLSFQHTAGTFADVVATPAVTALLTGDECLRMYRVGCTTPRLVDMQTGNGTATPIGDTILSLYDPDLDFVCDVDDDNALNQARGYYSRIRISLPASSCLVAVAPYPAATGGYTLSTNASGTFANTGTARFGTNALAFAGFGTVNSYSIDNVTPVSVRYRADNYWYAVMGPGGQLADCWYGTGDYPQSGELPTGTSRVLTWDRYDYAGPISVTVLPSLAVESNQLVSRGKAGDAVMLLGSFQTVPGVNLGIGDSGFFCLPVGSPGLLTVGLAVLPATGQHNWLTVPPGSFGFAFQSGDIHTGASWNPGPAGTWRNVLRL
ncbi:MAG: hypothetical protein RL148_2835, partial [Planctomycetota bacterium]|jgi:hypothetical protein